jgi:hypothetical protein
MLSDICGPCKKSTAKPIIPGVLHEHYRLPTRPRHSVVEETTLAFITRLKLQRPENNDRLKLTVLGLMNREGDPPTGAP